MLGTFVAGYHNFVANVGNFVAKMTSFVTNDGNSCGKCWQLLWHVIAIFWQMLAIL